MEKIDKRALIAYSRMLAKFVLRLTAAREKSVVEFGIVSKSSAARINQVAQGLKILYNYIGIMKENSPRKQGRSAKMPILLKDTGARN